MKIVIVGTVPLAHPTMRSIGAPIHLEIVVEDDEVVAMYNKLQGPGLSYCYGAKSAVEIPRTPIKKVRANARSRRK